MNKYRKQNRLAENSSLEKGLEILRRVINDQGQTNIGNLTENMSMTNSTKHRYLSALVKNGMISRIGHGRYDIGIGLLHPTGELTPYQYLTHIARPILKKLATSLNATTHLGVLENDMVTYLAKSYTNNKTQGKQEMIAAEFTREGGQLEAYSSAIGRVLLSHLSNDDLQKYLKDDPFISLTKNTVIDHRELRVIIHKAYKDGYAIDDGEISEDLYCVAVPITCTIGNISVAISASFSKLSNNYIDFPRVLEQIKSSAKTINHRLMQTNRTPKCV